MSPEQTNNRTDERPTVVLLSGGIDSSATVVACTDRTDNVSCIFMDYGQSAAESEWVASKKIAAYFDVEIERVQLGFGLVEAGGEFFGRNALFVLAAAGLLPMRPLVVALGVHSLSNYYDTTPLFAKHMERLLNGYSGGDVTLRLPFLTKTKQEVIEFAKRHGVPLGLTYSCERQNAPACGHCPSCHSRRLFYGGD